METGGDGRQWGHDNRLLVGGITSHSPDPSPSLHQAHLQYNKHSLSHSHRRALYLVPPKASHCLL